MKRDIQIILDVATQGLEKQLRQKDPALGADGHLYFLLEALAECRLNRVQQTRVTALIALHQCCRYRLTFEQTHQAEKLYPDTLQEADTRGAI